jgi:hypothetical protein
MKARTSIPTDGRQERKTHPMLVEQRPTIGGQIGSEMSEFSPSAHTSPAFELLASVDLLVGRDTRAPEVASGLNPQMRVGLTKSLTPNYADGSGQGRPGAGGPSGW